MAFGDTITITINSVAKVLKRIKEEGYSSEYLLRDTDREFTLNIRNSRDKVNVNGAPRERHYIVFTETIFEVPGTSPEFTRTISCTVLKDKKDVKANALLSNVGFVGFLTSTNLGKMYDWES